MIQVFAFTQGRFEDQELDPCTIQLLLKDEGIHIWVDLSDATAEERKTIFEDVFQFHPLAIEDCLSHNELPKVEVYDHYLFLVFHAVEFNRETERFETSELDMFIGKNFLVTYHVKPMKSIQAAIDRCVKNPTQLTRGPDRVAHTILDVMVDHYLPVLNEFSEDINEFERQITGETATHRLDHIMRLKRELTQLGQIIRPQREMIHRFVRGEFPMIRAKLIPYYRDVYDHLSRYQDLADAYRDSLNATLQVILSLSANQTSEILKFLTLITVVTMPVVIIGTWYGMNFDHMPELRWQHGYLWSFIATLVTTLGTIWYFRLKKWL